MILLSQVKHFFQIVCSFLSQQEKWYFTFFISFSQISRISQFFLSLLLGSESHQQDSNSLLACQNIWRSHHLFWFDPSTQSLFQVLFASYQLGYCEPRQFTSYQLLIKFNQIIILHSNSVRLASIILLKQNLNNLHYNIILNYKQLLSRLPFTSLHFTSLHPAIQHISS